MNIHEGKSLRQKRDGGIHLFSCHIRVLITSTVKPVLRDHSKRGPKTFFKTDFCLMQV